MILLTIERRRKFKIQIKPYIFMHFLVIRNHKCTVHTPLHELTRLLIERHVIFPAVPFKAYELDIHVFVIKKLIILICRDSTDLPISCFMFRNNGEINRIIHLTYITDVNALLIRFSESGMPLVEWRIT